MALGEGSERAISTAAVSRDGASAKRKKRDESKGDKERSNSAGKRFNGGKSNSRRSKNYSIVKIKMTPETTGVADDGAKEAELDKNEVG